VLGTVDLRDRVRAIACPVLVMYGSRDAAMVAGEQMLCAALRRCELHVLADVGHEPFIEAPEETQSSATSSPSKPRDRSSPTPGRTAPPSPHHSRLISGALS
jgi:alpha-beta hydrolase superfamily lysophospholipase